MKNNTVRWAAAGLAFWVVDFGAFPPALAGEDARDPPPVHFSGLLNDYTPSTVMNGPYEMRGRWSLDLLGRSTAHFTAVMNMETTDAGAKVTQTDPTTRGAHTHHIRMTDGVVSDDVSGCPVFNPATSGGFVVTGHADITGNGAPAPFGNPSLLTICVLGVAMPLTPGQAHVTFANITLAFTAPASNHFGTQAIHGVVTQCSGFWGVQSLDCTLEH